MSKAALARRIGVGRSYVTKLESGLVDPGSVAMLRIAQVLDRPVEVIFELVEPVSGKAPFRPISRRASTRAGEPNNMVDTMNPMKK